MVRWYTILLVKDVMECNGDGQSLNVPNYTLAATVSSVIKSVGNCGGVLLKKCVVMAKVVSRRSEI